MTIFEIILIGIGLSMDAVAVSMTNGMTDPKMRLSKMALVAFAYGLFQFMMPVIGYYFGYAFSSLVEKIAPWVSFVLLGLIGGKMVVDFAVSTSQKRRGKESEILVSMKLGVGKVLIQALATSIDALAVGVALLAAEKSDGLPCHIAFCALFIGATTFSLSLGALAAGKKIGDKFADKAGLFGGIILILIGIKLLIEGLI